MRQSGTLDARLEDLLVHAATQSRNLRALAGALALAAALGAASNGHARTDVGGIVESDASWDPAGNPYVLTDDVTVAEGVTLTLLPGVVVKADSTTRELSVLGTLDAKGTSERPIVLTSYKDDTASGDTNGDGAATTPAFGDWVGVGFAASSPGGIGDFVEIRYAGYYGVSGTNFGRDPSEVTARVQIACMRCHAFPSPDILPRELWRTQITAMKGFVSTLPPESGGSPIGFSLREVAGWYETQSPEVFALPRSLTHEGPGPIRFRRRGMKLDADGIPALATAQRLEAGQFGEHDYVLSTVDMLNGNVYLISLSEGPIRIGSVGHAVRAIPGDINGDGRTDLVVSDLGVLALSDDLAGRVVIALQQPDGSFSFEPILEGVGRVADARPLDVDRDGDLDVVVASFGWHRAGGIYLLRNEMKSGGPLKFRTETVVRRAGAVSVVPMAARKSDPGPGFAVAFAQQYEYVSVFRPAAPEGDGKSTGGVARGEDYKEHVLYRAPHPNWGTSNLEGVDLDGDSDLDLLLAHGDTLDDGFAFKPYHGVMWLENLGGDEFAAHQVGTLYGAHRAEAADFDGDGDLDIFAVGYLPQVPQPVPKGYPRVDSIIWFEHAGQNWIPWSIEVGHPRHTGATVLDFDRDGRPDLIAPVNNAWEIKDRKGGAALEVWFNRAVR